jgi:hypothetical protein
MFNSHVVCATRRLVPTRCPVRFLTCVAAIPGGLALRANLEVFQKAHDRTPVVATIITPLQRDVTEPVDWIMTPLLQPMYHAGQDIRGDIVPVHDLSRCGAPPSGIHHMPNFAGVGYTGGRRNQILLINSRIRDLTHAFIRTDPSFAVNGTLTATTKSLCSCDRCRLRRHQPTTAATARANR